MLVCCVLKNYLILRLCRLRGSHFFFLKWLSRICSGTDIEKHKYLLSFYWYVNQAFQGWGAAFDTCLINYCSTGSKWEFHYSSNFVLFYTTLFVGVTGEMIIFLRDRHLLTIIYCDVSCVLKTSGCDKWLSSWYFIYIRNYNFRLLYRPPEIFMSRADKKDFQELELSLFEFFVVV